jgi:hypothetical protein
LKKTARIKVKSIAKPKTRKKRKPYFGKEAHASIVKYQNCDCKTHKNEIYVKEIRPSFEKLVENLIFIHGFSSDKNTFHILKSDCISFLFQTLQKFDPSKGSKAFSYFNVCAKNFLIIQQKKKTKNRKRNISLFDEGLSLEDKKRIENHAVIPSQESVVIREEDKGLIIEMIDVIKGKTSNENEKKCISAIKTLFKNIDDLDFLNKRAIFVYLRELSGLNAKQLSVAMSNLRKYYREVTKSNSHFLFFGE